MSILYNNNPIIIHTVTIHLVRGIPVFRATIVSPKENTHFPRTSHSHYVWRPQGFGSLPNSRPVVGKLPTQQFQSSMRSTSLVLLYTQLGRVSLMAMRSHPHTPDTSTRCVRPAATGSQSPFISVTDPLELHY